MHLANDVITTFALMILTMNVLMEDIPLISLFVQVVAFDVMYANSGVVQSVASAPILSIMTDVVERNQLPTLTLAHHGTAMIAQACEGSSEIRTNESSSQRII